MKIANILFVDTEKTLVKVIHEDSTADIMSYEKGMKKLGGWSEFDIEKATHEFYESELKAAQMVRNSNLAAEDPNNKTVNLKNLLSTEFDKGELFELKLSIFDLVEVKASKKRSLKSRLRKSKDLVEILFCLQSIRDEG